VRRIRHRLLERAHEVADREIGQLRQAFDRTASARVKQSKSQQIVANAYASASTTDFELRRNLILFSAQRLGLLRSKVAPCPNDSRGRTEGAAGPPGGKDRPRGPGEGTGRWGQALGSVICLRGANQTFHTLAG
jgi:hypothetical protein